MAKVISSTTGTRIEPLDTYKFIRGTTATFKVMFHSDGKPTTVSVGTKPTIVILKPSFLNKSGAGPAIVATIEGELVAGQEYEYKFDWEIPPSIEPLNNFVVRYQATIGAITNIFGDEFFEIVSELGMISIKTAGYATISDVRSKKFNIDDYMPVAIKKDLDARNSIIQSHIDDATSKLREEMPLFKQRGNTENYRLFVIYYTVWSLLLASRGEDVSSVSDSNLQYWRTEWKQILNQEKRKGGIQGIPLGRG